VDPQGSLEILTFRREIALHRVTEPPVAGRLCDKNCNCHLLWDWVALSGFHTHCEPQSQRESNRLWQSPRLSNGVGPQSNVPASLPVPADASEAELVPRSTVPEWSLPPILESSDELLTAAKYVPPWAITGSVKLSEPEQAGNERAKTATQAPIAFSAARSRTAFAIEEHSTPVRSITHGQCGQGRGDFG